MRNCVRNILSVITLVLIAQIASAEVVRLKSGELIRGSIVFQNEQVLVIKKTDGSRFQYLQTDVKEVLKDEEIAEEPQEEQKQEKEKNVTASLQFAGGMTFLPGNSAGSDMQKGGAVSADLTVGTNDLLKKGILLGGGLGYHMHYAGGKAYSFLPIQLRAEAPLTEGKHAPLLSIGVGYGIGLQKSAKGGAFADIAFGWRYQMSNARALSLSLFSNFQQTKIQNHTDVIDGATFVSPMAGRAFVDFGIRFAVYL